MRKPRCWFYGDLADRFQGGRWQRVAQVICDGFLVLPAISRQAGWTISAASRTAWSRTAGSGVSEGSFGGVEPVSDLGPCRGPRPTLQRATGHTGPGTSDSPIMTNWLSCRWTC